MPDLNLVFVVLIEGKYKSAIFLAALGGGEGVEDWKGF